MLLPSLSLANAIKIFYNTNRMRAGVSYTVVSLLRSRPLGPTTLYIITFVIMMFSIMAFILMTHSIMTLSITT
jgi:hypothetical protein